MAKRRKSSDAVAFPFPRFSPLSSRRTPSEPARRIFFPSRFFSFARFAGTFVEVHLSVEQHPRTDTSIRNRNKVEGQRRKRRSFIFKSLDFWATLERRFARRESFVFLFVPSIFIRRKRKFLENRANASAWKFATSSTIRFSPLGKISRSLGAKFSLRRSRNRMKFMSTLDLRVPRWSQSRKKSRARFPHLPMPSSDGARPSNYRPSFLLMRTMSGFAVCRVSTSWDFSFVPISLVLNLVIELQIFMQIHISETGSFLLCAKYYREHYTLDIVYVFSYVVFKNVTLPPDGEFSCEFRRLNKNLGQELFRVSNISYSTMFHILYYISSCYFALRVVLRSQKNPQFSLVTWRSSSNRS